MPHIDARTGEVVIRIVYDGAPEAGKTTNVAQLGSTVSLQRRGAQKSPGTTSDRTEFFDWLDFSGGYVDGRRVRCQLVSVPGQSRLLHRRRYLLEKADAIVFVADSRPDTFADSARNLATTARIVAELAGGFAVGFILQANKQDLAGAASPADVGLALGVPEETSIIGAVASAGEGVMQTFILAVRLATERVRAILLGEAGLAAQLVTETPDSLHTAMLQLDAQVARREPAIVAEPPHAEPEPVQPLLRANASERPELPVVADIASGHIWPSVRGRASVASVLANELRFPPHLSAWAPGSSLEIVGAEGWVLHTAERWAFDDESVARHRLLARVRTLIARIDAVPDGRTLLVARDRTRWRIWLATPPVHTAADELADLARCSPAETLPRLERLTSALEQLRALGLSSSIAGGLAALGITARGVALLSLDEPEDAGAAPAAHDPYLQFLEVLADLPNPSVQRWLRDGGRATVEQGRAR